MVVQIWLVIAKNIVQNNFESKKMLFPKKFCVQNNMCPKFLHPFFHFSSYSIFAKCWGERWETKNKKTAA